MFRAAPDVVRGMEGSPGHQAAPLNGRERCGYNAAFRAGSYARYESIKEVFRTLGGYDWMTAKVGGVWDTMLAQGLPAFIVAGSNFHRHWQDRTKLDTAKFSETGVVAPTDVKLDKSDNEDFFPGEYSKTWVYAKSNTPEAILEGMRNGAMYTVLGGLIEGLEMFAVSSGHTAIVGGTLELQKPEDSITVVVRIKLPKRLKGDVRTVPTLHHIDLIAGLVEPRIYERNVDLMEVPSASVVGTYLVDRIDKGRRRGNTVDFAFTVPKLDRSVYFRIRGTNRADLYKPIQALDDNPETRQNDILLRQPPMDTPAVNPFEDLWFYSNPIWIRPAAS